MVLDLECIIFLQLVIQLLISIFFVARGVWDMGGHMSTYVISLFLGNGSATEYHYDMRYSALAVQVSGGDVHMAGFHRDALVVAVQILRVSVWKDAMGTIN